MQITRVWGSFQCLKANMLEAKEPRLSFIGREKRDRFQGTGNVVIEDGLCGQLPPLLTTHIWLSHFSLDLWCH